MSPSKLEINLDQALYVLSDGLDFVGIDDIQHGKRVAYMALETARVLKTDAATLHDIYYAALIHDLGVSSTEAHRHLVSELEWSNYETHCAIAAELLKEFRPLAHLAEPILHHHTHWEFMENAPLSDGNKRLANLIFLCDRVDAVRAQHVAAGDPTPGATARNVVAKRRGTFFDPHLIDPFLIASESPDFWARMAPQRLEEYFAANYPPDPRHTIGIDDIRDLGRLFAHVVDAKSPFTARHSEGVAQLSCRLARRLGLPEEEIDLIATAALLHDLGKLRVPDAILDKPGPLNDAEKKIMQRHAYDSYDLLHRINGFELVAQWAGQHHETMSGGGYPENMRRKELPVQSRVISVADVFQALAQDRPYRRGLTPTEIIKVLHQEVEANHLDGGIVALVQDDLEQCWRAALGNDTAACNAERHPTGAGGEPTLAGP